MLLGRFPINGLASYISKCLVYDSVAACWNPSSIIVTRPRGWIPRIGPNDPPHPATHSLWHLYRHREIDTQIVTNTTIDLPLGPIGLLSLPILNMRRRRLSFGIRPGRRPQS